MIHADVFHFDVTVVVVALKVNVAKLILPLSARSVVAATFHKDRGNDLTSEATHSKHISH